MSTGLLEADGGPLVKITSVNKVFGNVAGLSGTPRGAERCQEVWWEKLITRNHPFTSWHVSISVLLRGSSHISRTEHFILDSSGAASTLEFIWKNRVSRLFAASCSLASPTCGGGGAKKQKKSQSQYWVYFWETYQCPLWCHKGKLKEGHSRLLWGDWSPAVHRCFQWIWILDSSSTSTGRRELCPTSTPQAGKWNQFL